MDERCTVSVPLLAVTGKTSLGRRAGLPCELGSSYVLLGDPKKARHTKLRTIHFYSNFNTFLKYFLLFFAIFYNFLIFTSSQ